VPLPRALAAWAIDSGLPHAVSGDVYRRVRCAELERDDVNVRLLPQRMLGADFLQLREGITDPVSALVPAVEYGVRAATLFPLEEHARARGFLALLGEKPDDDVFRRIGELMYESHAGYSLCGLGVPRTDEIVEAVREAGVPEGLIGARVSGGGSGGAVVVLGRPEAEPRELFQPVSARVSTKSRVARHSIEGWKRDIDRATIPRLVFERRGGCSGDTIKRSIPVGDTVGRLLGGRVVLAPLSAVAPPELTGTFARLNLV
jgi:hypothetical protein